MPREFWLIEVITVCVICNIDVNKPNDLVLKVSRYILWLLRSNVASKTHCTYNFINVSPLCNNFKPSDVSWCGFNRF